MLFHSYSISKIRTFLLFITLFFLLLLPTSHQRRALTHGNSAFTREEISKEEGNKEMLMANSMIGSRPPQCKMRCLDCVHCEAVQVPATPQGRKSAIRPSMNTNARDDGSNYKPMDWKCKCGNFIFNP